MAAAVRWFGAVASARRSSSLDAVEDGHSAIRWAGIDRPFPLTGNWTAARVATGIRCSTAGQEIAPNVEKKRGRGRPRKVKVPEEQAKDASRELESDTAQDSSTSSSEAAQNQKVEDVGASSAVAGASAGGLPILNEPSTGADDEEDVGNASTGGGQTRHARYNSSNRAQYEALHARIEKELERLRASDPDYDEDEDDDYPLIVDEDDPTWPAEGETGWGFRVSEFFDEKKVKVTRDRTEGGEDDSDSDDELDLNWDEDYEKGFVRDITAAEWEPTVFDNMSPVVVYVYERYGTGGRVGWQMLKEVEKTVDTIWTRVPVRAVKLDAATEVDLVGAMKIEKTPVVLLIKSGKIVHHIEGFMASDQLCQIAAHYFYGARRPSWLEKPKTSVQMS